MPVQMTFVFWAVLMLSLAQIVRWECIRRRRGPELKLGHLEQLNSPRLPYTPPPDRGRRFSLDQVQRSARFRER